MSRNPMYDQELSRLTEALCMPGALQGFDAALAAPEFGGEARLHALVRLITSRMLATYEAKDTDYSENDLPMGNLRESAELGIAPWRGVLLRIGDKKRRIGSFVKRASYEIKDEGVDDALVDLSNYALLGLVLFKEELAKKLASLPHRPDTAYRRMEDCQEKWRNMAFYALQSKLLYDCRHLAGDDAWKGESWHHLLSAYDQLAAFSRYEIS